MELYDRQSVAYFQVPETTLEQTGTLWNCMIDSLLYTSMSLKQPYNKLAHYGTVW